MDEENKNKVSEPLSHYNSSKVETFHSLNEMNNAQYKHWADLTPEQRLAEHYQLLIRAYNYKENNAKYDKVYFD